MVAQIRIAPKLRESQSGMSPKLGCHSNFNGMNLKTIKIEKIVSPKTSNSASIGWISILFILKCSTKYYSSISLWQVSKIIYIAINRNSFKYLF